LTLIADLGWSCCRIAAMCGHVVAYERTVNDAGLASMHEKITSLLDGDAEAATYTLQQVGFDASLNNTRVRPAVNHALQQYVRRVVEEVRYCGDYMQRQNGDAGGMRLILLGGGADIPGMTRILGDKSAMDIETVTPGATVECPPALIETCNSAAMTVALGLARHGGGR
jgi:Tfp pilus assembly PilM family ATPase